MKKTKIFWVCKFFDGDHAEVVDGESSMVVEDELTVEGDRLHGVVSLQFQKFNELRAEHYREQGLRKCM